MSHNIDKIMYINLNKRTDRRNEIEQELNNFGLEYDRFEAIETPNFGAIGCFKSHLSVLKLAKERNYQNILILEDDFIFLVSKEKFEQNLSDFFSLNLPFDLCMLSYNLIKSEELENNLVNKVIEAQTASGYIVNNHYYDKLIQLYEWALPLYEETGAHWIYANDQIWKQYQPNDNWYYFKTRLGKQSCSYSDLGKEVVDYHC
jgi:GR25 family glycosyltransferase involved in LPS biosynthesis